MDTIVSPGQTVSATVLDENRIPFSARVISRVNREVTVVCEMPPGMGDAIRIDVPGYMLLGEVVRIQSQDGAVVVATRHCIQWQTIDQMRKNWM